MDTRKEIEAAKQRSKDRAKPPRPPIGPSDNPPIPECHELEATSSLTNANGELIQRWDKTRQASSEEPAFPVTADDRVIRKVSSMLDSQGQVRVQWVSTDRAKEELLDQFWQAAAKHAANFQGIAKPVPTPYIISDEKLNIFPLGDPHIGMLAWGAETGENFDLKIATADLLACVDMLAERAPQARRAALINVGDFAHAQSDDQRTPTGGNKLDVDGRFGKVAQTGFAIMIHLTNRLLERHEIVDVFNARGNHDPLMAQLIAMYLQAWYRNEPRVTVHDAFNPFQYIRFGKNLIGIHHGDGAKPSDLPEIMAADRPQDLGETEFRLWVTGHIHHETCKEFRTCTVESFRTLAAKDFWHHWKGYRSGQSLSALTFHKDYGEISRSTVPLKLARARQAALGKAA